MREFQRMFGRKTYLDRLGVSFFKGVFQCREVFINVLVAAFAQAAVIINFWVGEPSNLHLYRK